VTQTVSNAVAQRDDSPVALIATYSNDFSRVLPSHIKPETWVRLAQGALKKGRRITDQRDPHFGWFELEAAAANNPGVFLAALLDAARLGLTPGSEEFYLTPRKVKGRLEILGIVGYMGYIELMYRAGAVSSVVAEVVRESDVYRYDRGSDEFPVHRFTPFAREAVRGPLVGTYAYARMKDGAISRVVELNQDDIDRIKAMNPFSGAENSPWVKWENGMWLKSSTRQLRKWVPTSAEYIREQARALAEASRVADSIGAPPPGSASDEGVIEGDIVEEPWPATAEIPGDEAGEH
jgi:recombination protein RecT